MDPNKVFFNQNNLNGMPELCGNSHRGTEEPEQRVLGGNRNSYLVDEDGIQYDADSLTWRYLVGAALENSHHERKKNSLFVPRMQKKRKKKASWLRQR